MGQVHPEYRYSLTPTVVAQDSLLTSEILLYTLSAFDYLPASFPPIKNLLTGYPPLRPYLLCLAVCLLLLGGEISIIFVLCLKMELL